MTQAVQSTSKYHLRPSRMKKEDKPTVGHKLHHDVGAAGVRPDKRQTAGSGPDAESWLNQRVHSVARQISGVPAGAAAAVRMFINIKIKTQDPLNININLMNMTEMIDGTTLYQLVTPLEE